MGWETHDPAYSDDYADTLMAHLDALGWALMGILLAAILTGCMVVVLVQWAG